MLRGHALFLHRAGLPPYHINFRTPEVPSITRFCHHSFHHGLVEICNVFPTSIKNWKEEFFFVSSAAFDGPMAYGATVDRVANPSPYLTPEE
ncbi:unnamed protein product [Lactuca virosa]|uniref:Uncharacterized protein n=1 Tax=Lactuca virosa TaxID=75947 RepID=A0AAU9NMG8_9ASTR|nr:unnamed protein product [Lactuca virosa]